MDEEVNQIQIEFGFECGDSDLNEKVIEEIRKAWERLIKNEKFKDKIPMPRCILSFLNQVKTGSVEFFYGFNMSWDRVIDHSDSVFGSLKKYKRLVEKYKVDKDHGFVIVVLSVDRERMKDWFKNYSDEEG